MATHSSILAWRIPWTEINSVTKSQIWLKQLRTNGLRVRGWGQLIFLYLHWEELSTKANSSIPTRRWTRITTPQLKSSPTTTVKPQSYGVLDILEWAFCWTNRIWSHRFAKMPCGLCVPNTSSVPKQIFKHTSYSFKMPRFHGNIILCFKNKV